MLKACVCWQWSQHLHRQCLQQGKEPLLLNLDETSVPVVFTHGKGNIVGNRGKHAWRTMPRQRQSRSSVHACFGLFTYHSDKWCFDRPSWMSKSVTEVTELCKSDIEMRRAWAFVAKDLKRFNLCHFNPKYGSGFELCAESFMQKNVLKLHLHICWKWLEKQHIRNPAAFKIDGVVPVHVKQPPRDCLGPKARNVNPMLYYLEMPKIGGVFWDGNEKAFTAYPVNPRWITGWLQGKKITIKDAAQVTFFF